jgi:hypothetical protein
MCVSGMVKNHRNMKKKAKQPIKMAQMFPAKSIIVVEVLDSEIYNLFGFINCNFSFKYVIFLFNWIYLFPQFFLYLNLLEKHLWNYGFFLRFFKKSIWIKRLHEKSNFG